MHQLLRGERVYFTPFADHHVAYLAHWLSDLHLQRLVNPGMVGPMSEAALNGPESWLTANRTLPNEYLWAVETQAEKQFIAIAALAAVDAVARHAEIGINIGSADFQGKGYGSEIMQITAHFAFTALNLNRLYLRVFSYNTRAIRLYEKLGYQLEATERQSLFRDGEYHDELLMGLLRSEWAAH